MIAETAFLHAAARNLSPESSAQCKDFNLKRVLFYRGNQGQLFQQNRPKAVLSGMQQKIATLLKIATCQYKKRERSAEDVAHQFRCYT